MLGTAGLEELLVGDSGECGVDVVEDDDDDDGVVDPLVLLSKLLWSRELDDWLPWTTGKKSTT